MVMLLVLTLAPWVLVAIGVVMALVWPAHMQWLQAQRAKPSERDSFACGGGSRGLRPQSDPLARDGGADKRVHAPAPFRSVLAQCPDLGGQCHSVALSEGRHVAMHRRD